MITDKNKNRKENYISLLEAARIYGCTQKHMALMARKKKLRAIKLGRNWVTTSEWLKEYKNNSQPAPPSNEYISLREAARTYGCTQRHLNLMARNGKLKSTKVGRNWVTTFKWLKEYTKSLKKKKSHKPARGWSALGGKPSLVFKKIFAACLISFLLFLLIGTAFVAAKQGILSLKPVKQFVSKIITLDFQSSNFILARTFYSAGKTFDSVFHPYFDKTKKFSQEYYTKYLASIFTDIKIVYKEYVEPIDKQINQKVNELVWKPIYEELVKPLGVIVPVRSLLSNGVDIVKTIAKGFNRVDRISNQFFDNMFKNIFAFVRQGLDKGLVFLDELFTKSGQLVINIVETTANFVKNAPPRISNFSINTFSSAKKFFTYHLPRGVKNLLTIDFLIPSYPIDITDQSFISIKDLYKRLAELREMMEGRKIFIQETIYRTIKEVIITKPVEIQVIKDEAVLADWKTDILTEVDTKLSTLETTIYETTTVENIYYYTEAAKAARIDSFNNEITFNENVDMNKSLTVVGSISGTTITGTTIIGTTFTDGTLSITSGNITSGNLLSFATLSISGNAEIASASLVDLYTTNFTATSASVLADLTAEGQITLFRSPTLDHSFSAWEPGTADTNVDDATLYINPVSADADTNLLGLAVNNSAIFMVDAEGDVFANSLTTFGSVNVGETTISTLTVENNTILGDNDGDTLLVSASATFFSTVSISEDFSVASSGWVSGDDYGPVLYVDVDTGNVGIGTTSPDVELDVVGAMKVIDGSGYGIYNVQNTLNFDYGIDANSIGHINFYGYEGGATQFRDLKIMNGKEGLIAMFDGSTGNVGIGTTSPDELLELESTAAPVDLGFHRNGEIGDGSDVGRIWWKAKDTQVAYIQTSIVGTSENAAKMYLGTSTGGSLNTAVTIDENGNVGINDTSPEALLEIYDNDIETELFAISSLSVGDYFVVKNDGKVGIGDSTPSEVLEITGRLKVNSGSGNAIRLFDGGGTISSFIVGGGSADIRLLLEDAGDTQTGDWLNITSYGGSDGDLLTIDSSGNVGIGTTGPNALLELAGAVDGGPSTTVKGILQIGNNFEVGLSIGGYNAAPNAIWLQAMDRRDRNAGTFPIVLNPIGGNVGIGTDSPGYIGGGTTLTVYNDGENPATLELVRNDASPVAGDVVGQIVFYKISGTDVLGRIEVESATSNTASGIMSFTVRKAGTGEIERMRIDENGNVGIGTTSPTSAIGLTKFIEIEDDTAPGIILDDSNGANGEFAIYTVNPKLYFSNEANNLMTIVNTGYVGIGTEGPDFGLEIITSSSYGYFGVGNAEAFGDKFIIDEYGNVGIAETSPAALLEITATSSMGSNDLLNLTSYGGSDGDLFTITSIGWVGIGTTGPGSLLYLSSATAWEPVLKIENTNADDNPPAVHLIKNSASPFAGDVMGDFSFMGDDSGGVETEFGRIRVIATTVTGGSEVGRMIFTTTKNGAGQDIMSITEGNVGIGTTGPDFGLEIITSSSYGYFGVGNAEAFGDKFIIDENGNVGIGTNSPAAGVKLHIAGSVADTKFTGNDIIFTRAGASYIYSEDASGTLNFGAGAGTDDITIQTDHDVIINNGNVGIYDTSPDARLSVVATSSYDLLNLTSYEGNDGDLFTITSAGFVGIGDTDPFYTLSVDGTASISDSFFVLNDVLTVSSSFVGINTTDPGGLLNIQDDDSTTNLFAVSSTSDGDYFVVKNDGKVGIGDTTPTAKLDVNSGGANKVAQFVSTDGTAYIEIIDSGGSASIGNIGNNLNLYSNGVNTLGMTIQSDGDIEIMNGNVGIGTEGPDFGLEIITSSSYGYFGVGNAEAFGDKFIIDEYGNVGIAETSPAALLEITATSSMGSNDLLNLTSYGGSDGDLFTITSIGWVGIGTTDPQAKLDIRRSTSDTLGDGSLVIGDDNPYWTFRQAATGVADLTIDRYYSSAYSEVMRIQRSTGNVGIGTSGPAAKFEIDIDPTVSDYALMVTDSADGDLFMITSQGFVGIGTTNLTNYILGVEHSNTSAVDATSGYGINLHNTGGLNAISSFTFTGGDHYRDGLLSGMYAKHVNVTENSEASELHFITTHDEALVEAMTISSDGNVGIGDIDPQYTLSVDGTASVSGDVNFGHELLRIDVANDYVSISNDLWVDGTIYGDLDAADIKFANDFIITEAEDENALLLLNQDKNEILRINEQGNLGIAGTASISGDLYVSGKIFAEGGIDPPYMLYDIMSRDRIKELAQKIPENKRSGAMTFYNGETGQMEAYFPETDEFSLISEMDKIQEQIDELQQIQDEINQEIDFQSQGGFTVSISSVFNALKELGVTIVNGVITAVKLVVDEVKTKILRIAVAEDQDNVVGTATIPAQSIEYRVENSLVEENSKIFVSFTSDTGGKTWHISEKVAGHGFTLRLSGVTPEELEFDYWIVLVEEEEPSSAKATEDEKSPSCGDGELFAGEECDDGNNVDGDGCDATCMNEDSTPITNEDEFTNEEVDETETPIVEETASASEPLQPSTDPSADEAEGEGQAEPELEPEPEPEPVEESASTSEENI